MPYVSPAAIVTGTPISKTTFGDVVKADLDYMANRPCARVYNNAAISVPNNAWTVLTFNSERYDNASLHNTAVNTSRLTLSDAGLWLLTGHAEFASNATGIRGLKFLVNGTGDVGIDHRPANPGGVVSAVSISTVFKFLAGEYVELAAYQNSGGALNVNTVASYSPEFTAVWLGLG